MQHLDPKEAAEKLLTLKDGWDLHEQKLRRRFQFADFKAAMDFVEKVAQAAEGKKHHPDIAISYNKVSLEIWTHDAKGLTEKDFEVAKAIDAIDA